MVQWQTFWNRLWRTLLAVALALAGFIWIVDPYENIPLSPPLKRAPAASNQRYAYPAVARNPVFDSAIIGTSTMRLIRPDALNRAAGGRFANLSMNSATAYEQMRIAEVFARNHPAAKTLVVGIDVVWCEAGEEPEKYTFRRFPEWMYDENPWNDLRHLLEFKTFEVLGRQAGFLLGLREARYGRDGYRDFLPPVREYDLEKARAKIYRKVSRKAAGPVTGNAAPPPASWRFPSHAYLDTMLSAFPAETRKVLLFVPYHAQHQAQPGTTSAAMWTACRERIARIAGKFANTAVLDFMIASSITTRDENYWDPLHYSNAVADRMSALIAHGMAGRSAPDGEYRIISQR